MDINYHSNRIVANRSTPNFYAGSTSRQYGSGVGAAIRLGLKSFVIPLAKRYGLPLAKNFLSSAAPEVLDLINGQKKPKAAFKSAVRKKHQKASWRATVEAFGCGRGQRSKCGDTDPKKVS